MPQKRAAYKEIRQSKKKHARNVVISSETKTLVKKYNQLLLEKKFDEAKTFLKTVSSGLHKAAARGIMHKNTASRKISRLAKKLTKQAKSKK